MRKKSVFTMAAAAPLKMSIAAAKRIKQEQRTTDPAASAGLMQLIDSELEMVAAAGATVLFTPHGNSSASSDSNGRVNNKILH